MLGQNDHRSYAQVQLQRCASTFRPMTSDNHNTTLHSNILTHKNTSVGTVSTCAKDSKSSVGINKSCLNIKENVMRKSNLGFCTVDHADKVGTAPAFEKVLGSTSTARSIMDSDVIPINNRFSVLSVPDMHQEAGDSGSLDMDSHFINRMDH